MKSIFSILMLLQGYKTFRLNNAVCSFKKGIILILLMSFLNVVPSEAQSRRRSKTKGKTSTVVKPKTSSEAKKRQAEAQKEIKLTEDQIKQNEAQVKKNLAELGKIDQEIQISNKKINELNSKLSKLSSEINSLETGISSNEKTLESLRGEYLKAIKKMRATWKNKSTLAFIFSSQSFSQAMRRMRYLREFSSWKDKKSEEITALTIDLKNQRDALAKVKDEQSSALIAQKNSQKLLATQHSKQEGIVAELKKNGSALQAHLKKKQNEASELGNMVSQLIAQEQRRADEEAARKKAAEEEAQRKALEEESSRQKELEYENQSQENLIAQENPTKKEPKKKETQKNKGSKESKPSVSSTDYASARKRAPRNQKSSEEGEKATPTVSSANDFASMAGKLPVPSTGSFLITSRFGRQTMPDLPDIVYDNPGIDAETDAGASARAVFNGKVSGVYLLPGYNTVVIVNHGNYYTVYGNIASPAVKTGDKVDTGSLLGKLALNDDDDSHSSIHFEVWKNREKLNPQDWLR